MATMQETLALNDAFSAPMMEIIRAVQIGTAMMRQMQNTMAAPADTASFDAMRDALAEAELGAQKVNEQLKNISPPPTVEVPVTWQTPRVTPFTSTGMERFRQEFASANELLGTLYASQVRIAQQAAQTDIFSGDAAQDLSAMTERIGAVQSRIQALERTPLSLRTADANAQLEQMRGQLARAVQAQEALNGAVARMDVQGANEAYAQLSQAVGTTERQIRDGLSAQEAFNRSIDTGADSAGRLVQAVQHAAAAWASVQTLEKVLDLSGQMAGTMARLDLMNDGLQTTPELLNMVYGAAQNARGSLMDMAAVVAKFGNNARDAFSSSEEVVAFSELIQKQMKIAGASGTEASNSMLQLSQALGSGVLRGDELNSIFEQAPNLIQNIADYLGVPLGAIREMASEGQLTADIVKAAMFDAAEDINAQFENMPRTWEDVWQSFRNSALMAFQPVLERINALANTEDVQQLTQGAQDALAGLAGIAMNALDAVEALAGFVEDNWPLIQSILMAAGAVAAQLGVKMVASSVMIAGAWAVAHWPLLVLSAVIVGVIGYAVQMGATFQQVCSVIGGVFGVLIGTIYNLFVVPFWNAFAAIANFVGNVFRDPAAAVQIAFYDMCLTVVGYVRSLADAIETLLNKIPGVTVDITSGLDHFYSELETAQKAAKDASGWVEFVPRLDEMPADSAWNAGYDFGHGVADTLSGILNPEAFTPDSQSVFGGLPAGMEDLNKAVEGISSDTGAMRDALDISSEDLKYLRDIAEREAVNRFTTAEIKIEQTNNNHIASGMDLDGIVSDLTDLVTEAVAISAKGEHV